MMEKKISELKNGDSLQGFFLLKQADGKTGSNGKRYLDLVVADDGGEINGKLWDCQNGEDEIYKAINLGLSDDFKEGIRFSVNPYGEGKVTKQIIDEIKNLFLSREIDIKKKFYDIKFLNEW